MSKFALRLTVCSTLLLIAAAALGFAGPSHADGVSVPDSSGETVTGGSVTSPDDLGGMPASVETLNADPKQTASGNPAPLNQNNARNAVERGYVRPFGWLLKRLKKEVPGDVVKVRLRHQKSDVWTYDVTILNQSGRYVMVSLNAATGVIISRKNR